mgnify:CR=1 FL=1
MNERITFISVFNDISLEKIGNYTKKINDKLCKVPFGKNVDNREEADTLPYHFTLSAWDISCEEKIIDELSKIKYPKLKILINNIEIMNGKENSFVLCFSIEKSEELKLLQSKIYQMLPSEKYNPDNFNFHITIHIDKDYTKIITMKKKLLENFTPFELEVDTFGLYEIYPAKLVKQFKQFINDKEYEEISPTAIVTSYPRIFTDIPYEKEIYNWLNNHCNQEVALYKNMAPEMEARYKLINKLLNKYGIKQVLELAAGYSSRGLIYSKKEYNYVELDLKSVSKNKKEMLQSIEKNIPKSLNIISGNALKKDDFKKLESYFKTDEQIAVINEGLLRYLTFDEKRQVAQNIYELLSKYGGIWITSDVTPKKFIESQNNALQNFNKNVSSITSRNNLNDRFEDVNHIKKFFGNIGFELVEIHKFNEMKDELYSINELSIIDEKIEKTLEDAIVVVMKIKK